MDALKLYAKRVDQDDDSGINNFIKQYPNSPWCAALLLNLGLEYRQTGWFLKTLAAWDRAWELGKCATEPKAKALADRIIGELAEFNARLGRYARVEAILKEIKDRPLRGSATEKVTGARESNWLMREQPGRAFTCGPAALNRLDALENPKEPSNRRILDARSTERGMTLTQLMQLARKSKMDYVAAKRQPGAKVIVPSLVSWKVEHFAALLKEENGHFLIQDPALGGKIWVSRAALDAESSGYFLVPRSTLSDGWQLASAKDASKVWGRGDTTLHDADGTKPYDEKAKDCPPSNGMAVYNFHLQTVSINITDTPVGYQPPIGPSILFTVTYNSREANQEANLLHSNFGQKWNYNWLSYVQDYPFGGQPVFLFVAGGGRVLEELGVPEAQTGAVMRRLSLNPPVYERTLSDGSREMFAQDDGQPGFRHIFMTERIDPAGNSTHLNYDGIRLISIVDPLEQPTTISYEESDPNLITKVTDPFDRFAKFDYRDGQLVQITDTIGIVSIFEYEVDRIKTMTTPYGVTTFETSNDDNNNFRVAEAIDQATLERERVEFAHNAVGFADDEDPDAPSVPNFSYENHYHNFRNVFFWDKKAMHLHPPVDGVPVYTKAKLTQFLHSTDNAKVGNVKEREKQPLENPVYYFYEGQGTATWIPGSTGLPGIIAQKLADGSSKISRIGRNTVGNPTQTVDPVGRALAYSYWTYNSADPTDPANMVDVREVRQVRSGNELLFSATYTSQHRPDTVTDAAGNTTSYFYNSRGQILTVQNAKHETTHYGYGDGSTLESPLGYLTSITGPTLGPTSPSKSFAYDGARRVKKITTSPDAYEIRREYDDLDRLKRIIYPDGTDEAFQYTDDVRGMTLDLTASKDRLDRWTYRHYNANRQMDSLIDPLGRPTAYEWCSCGALERITDAEGHETTFNRDLQGRVYQKVFPDLTTINYLFEGQSGPEMVGRTSRLESSTDALNQTTHYQYYADGSVKQVSYTNAQKATPTTDYSYDDNYNRIRSVTAAGMNPISYEYYQVTAPPTVNANRLKSIGGVFVNNTITYGYDELGRILSWSVNGVTETAIYDSIGRLSTTSNNVLGEIGLHYDGVTRRLEALNYPNGQTTNYDYLGNAEDRRLRTLQNLVGSVNLSTFDYRYDSEGQVKSWLKLLNTTQSGLWFDYDDAKQLTSARNAFAQSAATRQLDYDYDDAGNRTYDRNYDPNGSGSNGLSNTYIINPLNQIESRTEGGTAASPDSEVFVYDAVGNVSSDSLGKTFEWDAANRLVAINYIASGKRTEFGYDGLGRRVKIIEYGSGVTAEVEPDRDGSYAAFTTGKISLPAGLWTLTLQGLNPNGGDNTILLDSVTLTNVSVGNGSFEDPFTSNYQVAPTGTAWSFSGTAGVAHNQGFYTDSNPDTTDGSQVAFVRKYGSLSAGFSLSAGTYKLNFKAAQRGSGNDSSQRLRVTFRSSASVIDAKTFVWCGNEICEERDGTGEIVTKRFFVDGEQQIEEGIPVNYYYTRDHLGSIREVTDSTGGVKARYDYDPYGNRVVLLGRVDTDFGYTGHYFHQASGLNLTLYRAYDPRLGRWLSRDPIGETGGVNLYGYVGNDPIDLWDLYGLLVFPADWVGPLQQGDCFSPIPTHPSTADVDANMSIAKGMYPNPFAFRAAVSPGGPWDYKLLGVDQHQYEAFGNFNYGATGISTGMFTTYTLLNEAGMIQVATGHSQPGWGRPGSRLSYLSGVFDMGVPPYGDQPIDQEWIKRGISYATSGGAGKCKCK